MGKFDQMAFKPVKCEWTGKHVTCPGCVRADKPNALIVPLVHGHEWVCVPKKPKRKGTRKEASK